MNQQIEHVVTLPNDLQTSFDPVKLRSLEELGVLQAAEQVALGHSLGRAVAERVQHVAFKLSKCQSKKTKVASLTSF